MSTKIEYLNRLHIYAYVCVRSCKKLARPEGCPRDADVCSSPHPTAECLVRPDGLLEVCQEYYHEGRCSDDSSKPCSSSSSNSTRCRKYHPTDLVRQRIERDLNEKRVEQVEQAGPLWVYKNILRAFVYVCKRMQAARSKGKMDFRCPNKCKAFHPSEDMVVNPNGSVTVCRKFLEGCSDSECRYLHPEKELTDQLVTDRVCTRSGGINRKKAKQVKKTKPAKKVDTTKKASEEPNNGKPTNKKSKKNQIKILYMTRSAKHLIITKTKKKK